MDVTPWIAGITSLASAVKVWLDLKRSSTDLQTAKKELSRAVAAPISPPSIQQPAQAKTTLVIDKEMLDAFIADILTAKARFIRCINDARYTPADVDREEERARRCVCTHLKKIREFNAGVLPAPELERLALSFRCDA